MMMYLKAIKKSEKEAIEIMAYKGDKIVTFFANLIIFVQTIGGSLVCFTIFGALVL